MTTHYFRCSGLLTNVNTIEAFKDCNKMELIEALGTEVCD